MLPWDILDVVMCDCQEVRPLNIRWFSAPLILAAIVVGWLILTAGRSFVQVDGEEAWRLVTGPENVLVLDVSEARFFEAGHIAGAVNVDIGELRDMIRDMDREQPILVVSARGSRSLAAANMLIVSGFKRVYHLQGGMDQWPGPRHRSRQ